MQYMYVCFFIPTDYTISGKFARAYFSLNNDESESVGIAFVVLRVGTKKTVLF